LLATSTALDLVALTPTRWIAQGATIAVPLTVEALDLGSPKPNVVVNFVIVQGTAVLSAGSATTNSSGLATVTAQITNQSAAVQVSACVAPNNAPCQTFTLFSTPPSLWNLETVSGSSQFVLTAQSFQPLVMRVADGSAAANPVMGVNVTFQTTLTRVPDSDAGGNGGMPIILGTSQAQVATAQNGLASIMPSAQNVGPCDVFITVNAGASTEQFQLENLAAIVFPLPPKNIGVKAPTPTRAPQFSPQIAAPQNTPTVLFAVSQGISNNDPAMDAHTNACPEPSAQSFADGTSGHQGTSVPSSPTGSDGSEGSEPCVSNPHASKPAEVETPKKEVQAQSGAAPTKPSSPAKIQPNPVSSSHLPDWRPEDKRSCQVLAGNGPIL
jgi:hypothetical protein